MVRLKIIMAQCTIYSSSPIRSITRDQPFDRGACVYTFASIRDQVRGTKTRKGGWPVNNKGISRDVASLGKTKGSHDQNPNPIFFPIRNIPRKLGEPRDAESIFAISFSATPRWIQLFKKGERARISREEKSAAVANERNWIALMGGRIGGGFHSVAWNLATGINSQHPSQISLLSNFRR